MCRKEQVGAQSKNNRGTSGYRQEDETTQGADILGWITRSGASLSDSDASGQEHRPVVGCAGSQGLGSQGLKAKCW